MAFSLFSSKNRMLNIVINDHSIRFVELKSTTPPAAQRWNERFLPPGIITDGKIVDAESLSGILEECIDEWRVNRRQVRFLVPDPLVIIRKISIPADIQEDEIKGYLYLEMGSSIHLPFEEPVFDFYQLEDNGKTKDLLLFAAPEDQVMEYADLLSGLKLTPVAADISPLALYRLYYQLDQAGQDEVLFTVQLDLTGVNLCIFEGSVPYVMRHFPLPFNIENWNIKRGREGLLAYKYKGDCSELAIQFEDIFKEMSKLLDYYRYSFNNEKKDVTKILLNGDHPMMTAVFEDMKERFDVPVEVISLENSQKGENEGLPMNLFLSLGLALKEVQ